jgi:hypothetical protein
LEDENRHLKKLAADMVLIKDDKKYPGNSIKKYKRNRDVFRIGTAKLEQILY